ncbi:MAG: DNA recombination protein RmuC [Planctomycetota bacterium]
MEYVIGALAGLIGGGIIVYFVLEGKRAEAKKQASDARLKAEVATESLNLAKEQLQKTESRMEQLQKELREVSEAKTRAETEKDQAELRLREEKVLLEEARAKLTDAFKALASETLRSTSSDFLKLAKENFDKFIAEAKMDIGKKEEAIQGLVKPISESLKSYEEHLRELEKEREGAYSGLIEHIKNLSEANEKLRKEADNLVTALRKPQVRGNWGEMTLRRVVELAGMTDFCDFEEQVSVSSDDGRLRPDLVVRMPQGREIVIDAKVSLDAYLDAIEAPDEKSRKVALARHVDQVRKHISNLCDKKYFEKFEKAPEFVVMFIPGESLFSAAVEASPDIFEEAIEKRVVLATPTTLFALLRAIAYGWRQEQITRNAEEISKLGKDLYERISTYAKHMARVGEGISTAADSYNKAVGSLERNVLPQARRFKDLDPAIEKELPYIDSLDVTPRQFSAPELRGGQSVSDQ